MTIDEVGERTSGLTPLQAIQFLETQSVQLFKRHFQTLRNPSDLGFSTKMAADIATHLTTGLLTPIYQQLDPIRLAEMDRSLRIAKEYGERLKTDNVIGDAVDQLLVKYPSHGFLVDRREARNLFNIVEEPDNELSEIAEFFELISRFYLDKEDESFVWYLSDPSKPAPMPPQGVPETEGDQP